MYRTNKYNNIKTFQFGIWFRSKAEARFAQELELRKKAGDIKDWEYEPCIELEAYGKLICRYKVDFLIHHNDGKKEYVEVKGGYGTQTPAWRIKWKLFEAKINQTKGAICRLQIM